MWKEAVTVSIMLFYIIYSSKKSLTYKFKINIPESGDVERRTVVPNREKNKTLMRPKLTLLSLTYDLIHKFKKTNE